MKKKIELPPRDSWIMLKPGKAVLIDKRLSEIWHKKKREYREVRGNILAACYEVEYTLDKILCEVFFPGLDRAPNESQAEDGHVEVNENARALKELFNELFLKSASVFFGEKISLLKKLSTQIPALQRLISEDFVDKLDKVRKVRNRFAHYPVTFEPVGDPPSQKLYTFLACRDKKLKLDKNFFDECNQLFSSLGAEIEKVFKHLTEDASRV